VGTKESDEHTASIFRVKDISLKCWYPPTNPHSVTSQKTNLDTFTTIRTSNIKILLPEMQEVAHNHEVDHVGVVDPDEEDPGVVGHHLVEKRLDSHEEQVGPVVDLHVLEDLHVLVVDLLDLKQTSCQTRTMKLQLQCISHVVRQVQLWSTSLPHCDKIMQLLYLQN
jgi:hypothetical protein